MLQHQCIYWLYNNLTIRYTNKQSVKLFSHFIYNYNIKSMCNIPFAIPWGWERLKESEEEEEDTD